MDTATGSEASGSGSGGRARGRGRGRGGVGKFLRARGRRGPVLRAEFNKRATGDTDDEEVDSEEERQERAKYARRAMTTNAERYAEPEPDPHAVNPEGEDEEEPEVDLVSLTKKQLEIADREERRAAASSLTPRADDEEIDESIVAKTRGMNRTGATIESSNSRKGKTVVVEWDAGLDEMAREKSAAEALSDLKSRLKKQAAAPKPTVPGRRPKSKQLVEAPPLEPEEKPAGNTKDSMQGFLDDLLG